MNIKFLAHVDDTDYGYGPDFITIKLECRDGWKNYCSEYTIHKNRLIMDSLFDIVFDDLKNKIKHEIKKNELETEVV